LQVEWEVQKDYAIIELFGRITELEYMAFGISGAEGRSQMVYGDVVVAFYDRKELRFRAEDYYISHLSQCDGKGGVCPDERIGAKNDAVLSEIWRLKTKSNPIIFYDLFNAFLQWRATERMA
jgi:hypothetical protein